MKAILHHTHIRVTNELQHHVTSQLASRRWVAELMFWEAVRDMEPPRGPQHTQGSCYSDQVC